MNSDNIFPKVSVVIPAKNEDKNIARVLLSIQNQDYPKSQIETLLIDNMSTDKTVKIANSFEGVSVHTSSGTIAEMRNIGIDRSSGDVIAFIDADCIAPTNWLNQSISDLQLHKNTAIISAIMKLEDGVKSPWIEKYWVYHLRNKYKETINYIESISSFCFCARREDLADVGGFDATLITCEDVDLGYRIKNTGKSIIVDTRIETIHLGNAKTVWKFFLRQLWQGGSNLKSTQGRKFELSELASLVVPAAFLGLLLVSIILAVMSKTIYALLLLSMAIGLPAVITLKRNALHSIFDFFAYMAIWSTYLLGRGLGFIIKISRTSR